MEFNVWSFGLEKHKPRQEKSAGRWSVATDKYSTLKADVKNPGKIGCDTPRIRHQTCLRYLPESALGFSWASTLTVDL
jgi:hypothetical protein